MLLDFVQLRGLAWIGGCLDGVRRSSAPCLGDFSVSAVNMTKIRFGLCGSGSFQSLSNSREMSK